MQPAGGAREDMCTGPTSELVRINGIEDGWAYESFADEACGSMALRGA